MKEQKESKLFAFKLADKQVAQAKPVAGFTVRDGVAVAGCSGPNKLENYRYASTTGAVDAGIYC